MIFGRWAIAPRLPTPKTESLVPPTAEFASRQAKTLARNIYARVYGKTLTPFHFDSLGALCVVGHQTACAELTVPFARQKSVRFSACSPG